MFAAQIRNADDAFAQGSPSDIVRHDEFRAHLVGLLDELLNSALLTAATASIANWMMANRNRASRRNLVCYMPPHPVFFQQAMLSLSVSFETIELSSDLREYYDRLDFLRVLTLGFVESGELGGDRDPVCIEVLSASWQDLAGAGRAAVSTLGKHLSDGKSMRSSEHYRKVLEMLAEVELGHHPCVGADGTIRVPFRTERRTLERRPMNPQAYIVVGERIERVAVRNVSDRGIGVLGQLDAPVGTVVQLLVRPGLNISGKIVWVDAGRAGISLDQPLPSSSSLYPLMN